MEFKIEQKENFGGFSLSKPKPEEIKDKPASKDVDKKEEKK